MKEILDDTGLPQKVGEEFYGLLKTSDIHPMDVAIGAVGGSLLAGYQATKRHRTLRSGETPYSNKLRHELQHHLEVRQGQPPSFKERLKEKMIAGELRYARLAQANKNPAVALEALGGAVTGAVSGHSIGNAVRNAEGLKALVKRSAVKVADVIGLSREALQKKAEFLGVPIETVVNLELDAFRISKQASVSPEEQEFLLEMSRVQALATGRGPEPIKKMAMSPSSAAALQKQATMGELLMQKELERRSERQDPPTEMEMASTPPEEPEDYRSGARAERRAELLGIFGGPSK